MSQRGLFTVGVIEADSILATDRPLWNHTARRIGSSESAMC